MANLLCNVVSLNFRYLNRFHVFVRRITAASTGTGMKAKQSSMLYWLNFTQTPIQKVVEGSRLNLLKKRVGCLDK